MPAITTPTYKSTGGFLAALGTITADRQAFSATATWNNGAVTFTARKVNVTDTASAAGSLLDDLQVGGGFQVEGGQERERDSSRELHGHQRHVLAEHPSGDTHQDGR